MIEVPKLKLGKGMSALADFILCAALYKGAFDDMPKVVAICHPAFMRRFRFWRVQQYNIDFTDRDLM
jgi:hypothetical protein